MWPITSANRVYVTNTIWFDLTYNTFISLLVCMWGIFFLPSPFSSFSARQWSLKSSASLTVNWKQKCSHKAVCISSPLPPTSSSNFPLMSWSDCWRGSIVLAAYQCCLNSYKSIGVPPDSLCIAGTMLCSAPTTPAAPCTVGHRGALFSQHRQQRRRRGHLFKSSWYWLLTKM